MLMQVRNEEEHPPVMDVEGQRVDRPLRETGKLMQTHCVCVGQL